MKKSLVLLFCLLMIAFSTNMAKSQTVLKTYPLNSTDQIVTKGDYIHLDKTVTTDGNGAIKVSAKSPMVINDAKPLVIHLFNTGSLNIENAALIYKAKVKTENFKGIAFLEMWTEIPGKGKFFSRGLNNPIKGNSDWKTLSIPFYYQQGQKPGNVEVYLIIKGYGDVWIDDIKLEKQPLPANMK